FDEYDLVGEPPFGHPMAQMLDQLFGAGLGVRSQDHECGRTLLPLGVFEPDHGGLGDCRMSHQLVLDVEGTDPLSTRLDDILRPVGYPDIALRCDLADVTSS